MENRDQMVEAIQQKIATEVTNLVKLGLTSQLISAHELFLEVMMSSAVSFQSIMILCRKKGELTKGDMEFLNQMIPEKLGPIVTDIHLAVKDRIDEQAPPEPKVIIP